MGERGALRCGRRDRLRSRMKRGCAVSPQVRGRVPVPWYPLPVFTVRLTALAK